MSTISELFAPAFLKAGQTDEAMFSDMAADLGADSVRFLPVESIARAVAKPADQLCRACITGKYPTPCGQQLYNIALENSRSGGPDTVRTYEVVTG
jgi:amidophosphoribosyltransferase